MTCQPDRERAARSPTAGALDVERGHDHATPLDEIHVDVADVLLGLVNPASDELDEHRWPQAQAEALLPELLKQIEEKLAALALMTSAKHEWASICVARKSPAARGSGFTT